jgi:hypothetical protein
LFTTVRQQAAGSLSMLQTMIATLGGNSFFK